MFRALVLTLLIIFFMVPLSCSAQLSDPENVTTMKASLTQSGKITLVSSSSLAFAEDLFLNLYVPQNDSRQVSNVVEVAGPDDYRTGEDKYGNQQIVLHWASPQVDVPIEYMVKSVVDVDDSSSGADKDLGLTDLVRPSEGIIETAYQLGREKTPLNMLKAAAWVHDHVEYDLSCEHDTFAAEWVYDEGRGTCDEYSNLLLSLLKFLGYDAWYVAGYAYLGGRQAGATSFGSHAWIEARIDGETYSVDPTWAESPVDATHLVIARLPDSNLTELTRVKSRDIAISWAKDEPVTELLEYTESPRIDIELEAVPSEIDENKNVLVAAGLTADGCVLTNFRIASCVKQDGTRLLQIDDSEKPVAFCDDVSFHWTAEAPSVESGMKFTCPVNTAGGGMVARTSITVSSGGDSRSMLSVSSSGVFEPSADAEVTASVRNPGFSSAETRIFALLGDKYQERAVTVPAGGEEKVVLTVPVPGVTGEYNLTVFSSTGDIDTRKISVVSDKQAEIGSIEVPQSVSEGESVGINASVSNSGESMEFTLRLRMEGCEKDRTFSLDNGGTEKVSFSCMDISGGRKDVILSLADSEGGYQDSWTGSLEVTSLSSFKEDISVQIENFLAWVTSVFENIVRLIQGS